MRYLIPFLVLLCGACRGVDDGPPDYSACEPDHTVRCDGDVVQECIDGLWEDVEDCAAQGYYCHEEMSHCMD